jgi:DNA-binding MurR/RpiR family transcriptional regulator
MKDEAQSLVDFSQLIAKCFDNLTKSEKRIARYINRKQDEVAFMSALELAGRLGLSEATVVRFARSLGFGGFPEMRAALQESFRARVTHSSRLRGRLGELHEAGDILEQLTVMEIDYMTQALETVNRKELNRAVELLRSRQRIFVFGLGPSISLVQLLEIRLCRSGHFVIPLTTSGREVLDPLLMMTDQDLMFVIAFFDVNATLQMVLEYAKQVGCPVILLTDTLESMLADKAEVILSARRGPVSEFHSLVVPMTIINGLLLAEAQEDQERVMSNLDKLDQMRDLFTKHNTSLP